MKKIYDYLNKKYNLNDFDKDDTEKKYDTRKKEKSDFNEYGINIDGLDRDGYNINGIDENGVDRDGCNINGVDKNGPTINGIEGNRIKYPKRKVNYKDDDNGILYDQYGFDENGYNKYGRNVYGFDK